MCYSNNSKLKLFCKTTWQKRSNLVERNFFFFAKFEEDWLIWIFIWFICVFCKYKKTINKKWRNEFKILVSRRGGQLFISRLLESRLFDSFYGVCDWSNHKPKIRGAAKKNIWAVFEQSKVKELTHFGFQNHVYHNLSALFKWKSFRFSNN